MKALLMGVLCLLLTPTATLFAQSSSILRGVYLFGLGDVNLTQMRDSLGINTVETGTGYGSSWDNTILNNSVGIKLYNQRKYLADTSRAQRMIYEAEQPEDLTGRHNYFENHPRGHLDDASGDWKATSGDDLAGYMVQTPWPSDEYHYNQTSYIATFRMKIDPGPPPYVMVARCEVWVNGSLQNSKVLRVSNFTPGNYKDTALIFTVPAGSAPAIQPPRSVLNGGVREHLAASGLSSAASNANVDLRVYWYSGVTTYLDKVTVDDGPATRLFAGTHDATLQSEATTYGAYSNHARFYLVDEPYISAFKGFAYVGGQIKSALGALEPKAGTLSATYYAFDRYLSEAAPCQLMIDPYFIYSDIPHPSVTEPAAADAYGFARWDPDLYLSKLQYYIDLFLPSYRQGALAAQTAAKPWMIIPQLHGFFYKASHKYRDGAGNITLRPPSGTELGLSVGLALAYGAKGVLPYPYGTDYLNWNGTDSVAFPGLVSGQMAGSYYMNHWSDSSTLFGQTTWTGYKEKWDALAAINTRLKTIGDTLLALNWLGAKTWAGSLTETGTWTGLVSATSAKSYGGTNQSPAYVETGHLQRTSGTDYLVVVNRRCAPDDWRYLTLTLSKPSYGAIKVTDIEAGSSWTVITGNAFTDFFNPGQTKIYRLERGLAVTISGPTTRAPYEEGTYTATVTGGTAPYHYDWSYKDACGPTTPVQPMLPPCGYWVDTGVNSTTLVHSNQYDFQVRCAVSDASGLNNTSAAYTVTVGSLAKGNDDQSRAALEEVPRTYELNEAYPNPFNPTTLLRLALPTSAHVRVAVYDAIGREIALLVKGDLAAGYHHITWNGEGCASGMYLARVEVTDALGRLVYAKTDKMLLTK